MLRQHREVAVVRARNARTVGVPFSVVVLLLSLTPLALRADSDETSEVAPPSESNAILTEPPVPAGQHLTLPSSGGKEFWSRPQLTGEWDDSRDTSAENGLTFFGDLTQYYQGVTTGGLAQKFKYGGRGDYLIDVDTQKLGLWDGGHLDLRAETRLGQDCNDIDGTVARSNFAMSLPLSGENVTALTGVQYTHTLSESMSVFFGKLNILDGTPTAYARGMRLNYFWNVAMQSNLSRAYLYPSTLGAGVTVRNDVDSVFNLYLLDTHYTPTTSGLSNLFSNGMVAYGEYQVQTNWCDLPGHSAIGLLYSTAKRTTLDPNPYQFLEAILTGEPLPQKDSAWTVIYRFDQVVHADGEDARRNWTLNSDLGLTDGNPNPIRWFANVSLVGGSPIRGREDDSVGIGYYHLGVSHLPILTTLGFGAENGVELFYNAAITARFHVTPDLQILDPAQRHNATALLVGIRARLSF